jgi:SAM-dependent methyltransferase
MLTVDFERLGVRRADRALDMGCGAGRHAFEMYRRGADVVAFDQDGDALAGVLAVFGAMQEAGEVPLGTEADIKQGDALALPFAEDEFDVVVAAEVLEHLPDPVLGLAEMARVGRRHLVVSVPREPIFRGCNLVAGRYVRALGNTPGHLNHWTTRGFVRLVSDVAEVREVTNPFPWTTVWATLPGT